MNDTGAPPEKMRVMTVMDPDADAVTIEVVEYAAWKRTSRRIEELTKRLKEERSRATALARKLRAIKRALEGFKANEYEPS